MTSHQGGPPQPPTGSGGLHNPLNAGPHNVSSADLADLDPADERLLCLVSVRYLHLHFLHPLPVVLEVNIPLKTALFDGLGCIFGDAVN